MMKVFTLSCLLLCFRMKEGMEERPSLNNQLYKSVAAALYSIL